MKDCLLEPVDAPESVYSPVNAILYDEFLVEQFHELQCCAVEPPGFPLAGLVVVAVNLLQYHCGVQRGFDAGEGVLELLGYGIAVAVVQAAMVLEP